MMPSVPTVAEAGVPEYAATVWYGVFAPAGTPPAVVQRLNAELNKIVMMPEVTARFAALGAEPVAITPEAFATLVRSQMATVKDIAARARITLN